MKIQEEKNLEKILVTSALTYANGPLHIGHVAGSYLNADIVCNTEKIKKSCNYYLRKYSCFDLI